MNNMTLGGGGLSLGGGGLSLGGGRLSLEQGSSNTNTTDNSLVSYSGASNQNSGTSLQMGLRTVTPLSSNLSIAPTYTQQHMREIQSSTMFSVQDDVLRRKQADEMIMKLILQVQKASKSIDLAIEDFEATSKGANRKFADMTLKKMDDIASGRDVTNSDMNYVDALSQFAKSIANRYFETTTQLMDLQKINQAGKLKGQENIVEMVFDFRMKELKLFGERLQLMRKQETHEIDNEFRVRDQELKEQSMQFDSLMKVVKLENEKDQQEFNKHLAERQSRYEQEKDMKELQIKEETATGELKLKENQLISNEKIAKEKMQTEKDIETRRVIAQAATDITKTAIDAAKPSCSIM